MARLVIECMNRIFDVLIKAIADEDIGRIANVKRHIVARGDKTLVIDFVKNAKIKKIPLPYFNGCIFTYKDIKYFLVAEDYSAAMQEIGFDEIIDIDENKNNELEIIQGCEMLAICENVLNLNHTYGSLEVIDECLGLEGEAGNVSFEFSELMKFFENCSVFVIDDSRFHLQYEEDIYRLCCYCICDQSKNVNLQLKTSVKELLLLESSRSISASIINGLRSPLKEYSFLQYYQCLEYLFRLNNSFDLQDKFSIGVTEAIGIVTDYDFRLSEQENLRRVISSNISETDIDNYLVSVGENLDPNESKDKKCEHTSQSIYKIRCQIAHLRYGQDTYLDTLNWDKQLTGIVGLVLAIYQRCGTRIEATCGSNDAWHNIDFSKNG